MTIPFFTIKCPVCNKGEIPYPFEDKGKGCCEYCRNCGASRETIELYFNTQVKIAFFILKWCFIVGGIFFIFDFIKNLF